jgi:hypothetical protein
MKRRMRAERRPVPPGYRSGQPLRSGVERATGAPGAAGSVRTAWGDPRQRTKPILLATPSSAQRRGPRPGSRPGGRSGAGRAGPHHGAWRNMECEVRCGNASAAARNSGSKAEAARERNGPGWNVGSRRERGTAPGAARAGPGRMPGRRRERGAASAADNAAEMGARWMPRRWRPRKDAATRRNARGRRWQPAIPRSPNGATRRG